MVYVSAHNDKGERAFLLLEDKPAKAIAELKKIIKRYSKSNEWNFETADFRHPCFNLMKNSTFCTSGDWVFRHKKVKLGNLFRE